MWVMGYIRRVCKSGSGRIRYYLAAISSWQGHAAEKCKSLRCGVSQGLVGGACGRRRCEMYMQGAWLESPLRFCI